MKKFKSITHEFVDRYTGLDGRQHATPLHATVASIREVAAANGRNSNSVEEVLRVLLHDGQAQYLVKEYWRELEKKTGVSLAGYKIPDMER